MSYERLPKPETPKWLKFTSRKQRFVLISKIRYWVSHWDVTSEKSRRCGGTMCLLCQMGLPKVMRYVVLVLDANGQQRLVEFRARHYGLLEVLTTQGAGEVGAVVVGQKMGEAKNSPVDFKVTGHEGAVEQEIQRLVETFGDPPKFVTGHAIQENEKVEELLSGVELAMQGKANNPFFGEPT